MKDFMEKIKANKKMVAIAGIVILAIIIIAIIASQVGGSYKKTIKNFAKAMGDESKMEKFVDKNVNLRAIYAMGKVENKDNAGEESRRMQSGRRIFAEHKGKVRARRLSERPQRGRHGHIVDMGRGF